MMIQPYHTIIFLLFLSLTMTGCDAYKQSFKRMRQKKQRQEEMVQETVIEKVESLDLAKIILSPKQYKVDIEKDPFRPLFYSGQNVDKGDNTTGLENAKFLGLVKIGDDYAALLQVGKQKGAFAINEEVGGFIIVSIQEDFVELKKGKKTFQLKRGAK